MLIPNISHSEKWKQFFRRDIGRALGYCERIVGLYNKLAMSSSDIKTRKIVAGVIGKDTIGHWRDVQEIFKDFFGVSCLQCSEAVKNIAKGIPCEIALQKTSLSFDASTYIKELEVLMLILAEVYRGSGIARPDIDVSVIVEKDYNTLLNNPLHIIRVLKGLYTSLRMLLPLYNEFTYFLLITRNIDEEVFEKYFSNVDMEMLNRFGVRYRRIELCNKTLIFTHDRNSVGEKVLLLVSNIYRFFKLRSHILKKFIRIENEKEKFLENMLSTANNLLKDLEIKNNQFIYSLMFRNARRRFARAKYIYISTHVRIDRENCKTRIGFVEIPYKDFIKYVEPYMITGLLHLDNIMSKNNYVEMVLNVYIDPRNISYR